MKRVIGLNPAQDSNGMYVKQEFEFKIGKKLRGC